MAYGKDEYDAALDKVVVGPLYIPIGEARIEVAVRSYDGGPEKLALSKSGWKKDGSRWSTQSIGRLDLETAAKVYRAVATVLGLDGASTRGRGVGSTAEPLEQEEAVI